MRDLEAAPLLEGLPEEERFETWHLVLRDGSLLGHGTGGVELLRAMTATRPAAQALEHIPDAILDRAYAVIARHRSRLGSFVPDVTGPRRFP
jgi:predicted DCC family thiol-disulfide oxidoreductase YuxK